MSNPLGGLVGYDVEDDEEEDEEEENALGPEGSQRRQSDGPRASQGGLAPLVHGAPSSPSTTADDQDDLYNDLVAADDARGGAGASGRGDGDDASPVGRADAVDAQTDGQPEPSSAVPSPRAAADSGGSPGPAPGADPRLTAPPAPPGPCPPALQARITDLLEKQRRTGKAVLQVLRDNRDYRNPAFMEKMVQHYGVNQYGSSFPQDKFDPGNLPQEDYWENLNRALEDKRAERKRARIENQRRAAKAVNDARDAPPLAKKPRENGSSFVPQKLSKWDRP